MRRLNRIKDGIMSSILTQNKFIYRISKKMVDCYNNDNNCDMFINGELRVMKAMLPTAKVIFDIGANIGGWIREAYKINPKATFHCFEPSRKNLVLLKDNVSKNVIVNHFGLGDCNERREIFIPDFDCGSSSLYNRWCEKRVSVEKESIQLKTLDSYCDEHRINYIDFIKIDVEGHELSVLKGARNALREGRVEVVQFEYGGTYIDAHIFLKDIWEYVNSINPNFNFYKIYPGKLQAIPVYSQTLENFQYSNWVIINEALVKKCSKT